MSNLWLRGVVPACRTKVAGVLENETKKHHTRPAPLTTHSNAQRVSKSVPMPTSIKEAIGKFEQEKACVAAESEKVRTIAASSASVCVCFYVGAVCVKLHA